MVARVAKNIIRAMLREKMKELKVPSSEPYRQLVLTLLNLFSGHSDKAHEFWTSNKAPPIDEKAIRHPYPSELVRLLAHAKADAVLPQVPRPPAAVASLLLLYNYLFIIHHVLYFGIYLFIYLFI